MSCASISQGRTPGAIVACATWVPVHVPHPFMLTAEMPLVDGVTGLVSWVGNVDGFPLIASSDPALC